MANLVITDNCNFHCRYCFARPKPYEPAPAGGYLSEAEFINRLDFLARSGIDEVRLIGGEPTFHPLLGRFIELARRRFPRIVIFTHGAISERSLAILESLPPESCTILVNMTGTHAAEKSRDAVERRRLSVLQRLGQRAMVGFTIDRPNPPLDTILPLIARAGCRPAVRIGMAQPISGGDNAYLRPEYYRKVGQLMTAFTLNAFKQGISIHLDCGFVACMFSESDTRRLRDAGAHLQFTCSPVIDVGLDGTAMACFPLGSKVYLPLEAQSVAGNLRTKMTQMTKPYRAAGIYRECSSCPLKAQDMCTGGCLALAMLRFRQTGIRLNLPEIDCVGTQE